VPVSFIPNQSGSLNATVQIVSSNDTEEITPITLNGTGTDVARCQISSASLDFGSVSLSDDEEHIQWITISHAVNINNSLSPRIVSQDPIVGLSIGFSLSTSLDSFVPGLRAYSLAPGKSLRIPILFKPERTGSYNGKLLIHSFECGENSVKLKGTVR
jgi:hypothetical protein